jgi:hypothetical protein
MGHLEGIAAGAGLAAQAQDAVAAGESAFLAARAQGHGAQERSLTAKDVARAN